MPSTTVESERFTCPEDVVDRDIGEDLLVHKAVSDEVFVLNPDARLVFEEAKQSKTRDEIHTAIFERGFRGASVKATVDGVLDEMITDGILVFCAPSARLEPK